VIACNIPNNYVRRISNSIPNNYVRRSTNSIPNNDACRSFTNSTLIRMYVVVLIDVRLITKYVV